MRAVLFLLFWSFFAPVYANEGPFLVQIVKEVSGNKQQIFDKSGAWIAETFRSAKAVIEHKDKDAGLIIGNGAVEVPGALSFLGDKTRYSFKLKEEIKDGKIRLTFSNVTMSVDGYEKPIEDTNRGMNEPKLKEKFQQLADSLAEYIKQQDRW